MEAAMYNPRTVEEVFRDFKGRRQGIIKALTTVSCFHCKWFWMIFLLTLAKKGQMVIAQLQHVVLGDAQKENLCLYGFPSEQWEVNLPAEEVPPELPEPALGINFARDGMQEKDWLSLVAVHSDAWLLSVAFYFGARFGFEKAERKRLFNMINDLPTIFEVVSGIAKNSQKDKKSVSNHSSTKSKSNSKVCFGYPTFCFDLLRYPTFMFCLFIRPVRLHRFALQTIVPKKKGAMSELNLEMEFYKLNTAAASIAKGVKSRRRDDLNSRLLGSVAQFAKFANHALSKRNDETEVSEVELTFAGLTTQLFVKDIVSYAYLHNVRKLTIICNSRKCQIVPEYLFISHSLEHFTLNNECRGQHYNTFIPALAWDFPVLKTLYLSNICLSGMQGRLNLFSKCVNLKDITLHRFGMYINEFNVCCPQLSNLTITDGDRFPKVFNVVAPKLKNLTASVRATFHLRSFFDCLQSTEGFDSLETVNLFLSRNRGIPNKREVPMLLSAFQKLSSAKFLILNSEFIEALGSDMNQLSHEPCPFNNLKCLKIGTAPLSRKDRISQLANPVKNYLLENSPNATFIMDLPQKRPWEQLYNVAKFKVAKLEEKIQAQDEVITEHKSVHEKLLSYIIKCKMSELRMQVEAGNPDYEIIRVMGSEIKSVMDSIPKNLRLNVEAQFFSQYEALKCLLLTRIDVSRWAKIETELV
ncbi:F-box domain, cyclin-like protein [Artemisia annua]|uniref:PHD finger protein ALFIN-LIKE n=1 Tax=Artemisia annua TaxID=35608 RepID=A0A2U1KH89_ARTAN|nr:F-box domain, cyclin-like protein [Artemisia annua]